MIRGVVASGRRRGGVPVQIILTSGTQWTTPADWNNAANKAECAGAGKDGGGAYARKNNLALTPGQVVSYQIGTPSGTQSVADTWFQSTATVKASGSIARTGGLAADCVGDVKYSGGDGSNRTTEGGGGAAGPNGNGGNGTSTSGGVGDAGFGGVGGTIASPNGGAGTEWGSVGSGGGGLGSGSGGLYGGGSRSGTQAPGVIVITYTPA